MRLATARKKLDVLYKADAYLCSLTAKHVEARFHCAWRAQCFGSSPGIDIYIFFIFAQVIFAQTLN
jgi:hypothetical protein